MTFFSTATKKFLFTRQLELEVEVELELEAEPRLSEICVSQLIFFSLSSPQKCHHSHHHQRVKGG